MSFVFIWNMYFSDIALLSNFCSICCMGTYKTDFLSLSTTYSTGITSGIFLDTYNVLFFVVAKEPTLPQNVVIRSVYETALLTCFTMDSSISESYSPYDAEVALTNNAYQKAVQSAQVCGVVIVSRC